jgi:hypothetical protein
MRTKSKDLATIEGIENIVATDFRFKGLGFRGKRED